MNGRTANSLAYLAMLAVLVAGSGATCQRPLSMNPFGGQGAIPPQVLVDGASRDQIVAAINQNSAKIQSLSATGVSITIPDTLGLPLLSGNIAAERPGRFRLTAGTGVTGSELDVGSNDELFWMWMKRNQTPGVYYCRHDRFANSNIRQVMPVEPAWLLAALGMVDIDPASVYDGPVVGRDGRVEIRTWMPSASGRLPRIMVIDPLRALVVEQWVYDASGTTVLASAVAESHRYYPVEQVALPERITIRLPPAGLAFKIDLGSVAVNRLGSDPRQLFSMPAFEGTPPFDLSGAVPGTPLPGRAAVPQAVPMGAMPSGAAQPLYTSPNMGPSLPAEAVLQPQGALGYPTSPDAARWPSGGGL